MKERTRPHAPSLRPVFHQEYFMKRFQGALLTGALIAGLSLASLPASAGVSFDFLFSASSVSDDNQYFLNLAVGNYGYPRTMIEPVLPRVRYVEQDLPVILFLADISGRPIDAIVDLRAGGLGWSVVFSRVGVPYDVLFVGLERDPGPPYGKAWGHWKKNPKRLALSDSDIASLVNVQVGHRVTGISAYEIARARGQGKSIATVVADKKGRPHGAGKHAKSAPSASASKKDGGPQKGEAALAKGPTGKDGQAAAGKQGGKQSGGKQGGGKNAKDK
jgi:hypothetical protein